MKLHTTYLEGAVLPTVVVAALVMLTATLGLLALWEQETLLFTRTQRLRQARADVESAALLYRLHPDERALTAAGGYLLYDSLPQSRIFVRREPWGLYELLHITTADSLVASSRIVGAEPDPARTLFYADDRTAVTLAGDTRLHGTLRLPAERPDLRPCGSGVLPGRGGSPHGDPQLGSDASRTFGCRRGTDRRTLRFRAAAAGRPAICPTASAYRSAIRPSPCASARPRSAAARCAGGSCSQPTSCASTLPVGWETYWSAHARSRSAAEPGIAAQLFARDTVVVEPCAVLEYPSGIYAGRYAELGDRATADGYVIVRDTVRHKKMAASYRQSRTARVRGLLHADGAAQVQGIVAGCAELRQAVYFSPQGYYKDMLYDLTLLENSATAQPLWHGGAEAVRRKEAVCVE